MKVRVFDTSCDPPIPKEVTIPDGKWVASAKTWSRWDREADVDVGTTYKTIERISDRRFPVRNYVTRTWRDNDKIGRDSLIVSGEPFAVVTYSGRQTRPSRPIFEVSRQVHKGELGKKPDIAKPPCVLWPSNDGRTSGWVRLTDLAKVTGKRPKWLLHQFYAFGNNDDASMDFIFTNNREDIANGAVCAERILFWDARITDGIYDDIDKVWVRRGWANTVLYLLSFGWTGQTGSMGEALLRFLDTSWLMRK